MDNKINDALTDERAASISVSPTTLTFTNSASSKAVTVTCSDSSWTVGGSNNWCTITKSSNTRATVKVTANSGAERRTGVICNSGSNVAQIIVIQAAGASVSYNVIEKIKPQAQGSYGCAATCAAMCVNQSCKTLENDGFNMTFVESWGNIGKKYGYTAYGPYTADVTFENIFNYLKNGIPVIVKVNDGRDGRDDHWVVVVGYSGSSTTFEAKNFTCVDPYKYTSGTKALNSATNYTGIYTLVVYEKN